MLHLSFLVSRQLKVTNWKTDNESMITFKKGQVLEGVGVNTDLFEEGIVHILWGNLQFEIEKRYVEIGRKSQNT